MIKVDEKPIYRTYEDFPIEDLNIYAGIDCIATSEVAKKLVEKSLEETPYQFVEAVVKDGKEKLQIRNGKAMSILDSYMEYTAPALEFIIDMELNGIKYDTAKNRSTRTRMEEEVAALEDIIFTEIGRPINLDSGDILGKYIYEEKSIPVSQSHLTKTGEPSTDGETLAYLANEYDLGWLKNIGKRNDIISLYRTFITTYIDDFVKSDGRIHPSYNLNGTGSFRISGDSPNLTQVPRPKHDYNIRDLYYVDDDKFYFSVDYSSCEVKILGAISRDPALLKAIEEGKDFHSFSAASMNDIDYDEFVAVLEDKQHKLFKQYKEMRQAAKALSFGILYGSTANGIASTLGITVEKAKWLISLYFKAYPGIQTYVEISHAMAKLNHFVFSPFGQRKMEFGTRPVFEKTAVYNAALRNAQNVRKFAA